MKTPTKNRAVRPKRQIVAIDEHLAIETEAEKAQSDLLDLMESYKSKRILTGTIQGVEHPENTPSLSLAVIYHGDFKVIIPAEEAVEPPEDFRGKLPEDVLHYNMLFRFQIESTQRDPLGRITDVKGGHCCCGTISPRLYSKLRDNGAPTERLLQIFPEALPMEEVS